MARIQFAREGLGELTKSYALKPSTGENIGRIAYIQKLINNIAYFETLVQGSTYHKYNRRPESGHLLSSNYTVNKNPLSQALRVFLLQKDIILVPFLVTAK